MKKGIIVANGKAPSKQRVEYLRKIGYNYLVAADGGANSLYKINIIPDIIIGDLDSIKPEVLKYYHVEKNVEINKLLRQDDTDIEKALKYLIENQFTEVILLGAVGDRLDHSFCNIGIILKFFERIKIYIISGKSIMSGISDDIIIKSVIGETISIYGVSSKTTFTSEGLFYPLEDISLPFGLRESTSNVATSNEIKLKVRNGKGLIVRDFNAMKKNGLI